MCLGYAMQLIASDGFHGTVERKGQRREVSLLLTGDQPPGSWLLVHVDAAVRVLDPEEAALIEDAISALETALAGGDLSGHFADLNRPPELPPHLRAAALVPEPTPSEPPVADAAD